MTATNSKPLAPHITETAHYWEQLARSERSYAKTDRLSRFGTVESIRIHEQNAADYEARAKAIRERA